MIAIERVDPAVRRDVERFVDVPYRLYARSPMWIPPLRTDERLRLDRRRHPFYEHSDADFFVGLRDGRVVGRIAALENRPFNAHHHARQCHFYLFETPDDREVASALIERVETWAAARGLDSVVGPMGFGPLDGHGLLVEGFEHRQLMSMMAYNGPWYGRFLEGAGYARCVDFASFLLTRESFPRMSDRIQRVAERVERQGSLHIREFATKKDLRSWAPRIADAYNRAFVDNWEFYPLAPREVEFLVDNIMLIADPHMIKLILHGEDIVGFALAFPDLSAGLRRAGGRLYPFGLVHLLIDQRRTRSVALYAAGILPEFQGHGGNALLYLAMERALRLETRFDRAELVQVADTAVRMRHDMSALGGKPYKVHRVYGRVLAAPSAGP